MRILVIEDDPAVRRLLARVIERAGHTAILAETAGEGLRGLGGAPRPDLVILDRMLPDLDGADLLRRLRQDPDTRTLPVVVLTAAAAESAGLDDGGRTRVLAKPFDLAELRDLLAGFAGP